MKSVLITGGAGFIGGNFVHQLRAQQPEISIVVLDALTYAGNRSTLIGADDVELVEGDIRDTALVTKLLVESNIDRIVHFAAESHVDRSISAPDLFVSTNIEGTHSLLKAARDVWLDRGTGHEHRFHHVSTDEVYGSLEPNDPAFSETTPYQPNSPYSASKAASDHLVRAYHHTFGLNTTTSNCSNNYGPYQYPEKLIPLFLLNALNGRQLPIYGDGLNVRDWLHVNDHCRGIMKILEHGRSGETYNVGGGEELSNLTVIDRICEEVDTLFARNATAADRFPNAAVARGKPTASLKVFVEDRKGHDRRYAIDDKKLRAELNYAPKYSFETGLSKTLKWYLKHEAWWKALNQTS